MKSLLAFATLILAGAASPAFAVTNCPANPHTLTNGSTADANQVMDNFNNLLTCAATNGANSNITSLTGLTTPLSVSQGGTGSSTSSGARTSLGLGAASVENLGSNVADDGAGNLIARPVLHQSVFTSSGTFTTPTGTTTGTVYKFIITGGGGGATRQGSGAGNCGAAGGSGGTAIYWASGLSGGANVTVTVGGAGTAGSGGNGTAGGTSSIVIGATTISGSGGGGATTTCTGGGATGVGTNGTINISGGTGVVIAGPTTFYDTQPGSSTIWGGGQNFPYGVGGTVVCAAGIIAAWTNGSQGIVTVEWIQ